MPVPHRTDESDANTVPDPELNPLLNPLLAAHMGRWAEVYFTNPPEKRGQAIAELLRELENISPPEPASVPVLNDERAERKIETGAGAASRRQSRQGHSYRKSRKPCRLSEQVGENPNLLSVVTRLNTRLSPLLAPLPPADVTMPRNQLGRCRRRIPRISAWNPSLFPVVTDSISVWCWPSFSQCWFTWRGVERKLFRAQRLRSPHLRGPSPLRQRRPRNSRARQGLPCR